MKVVDIIFTIICGWLIGFLIGDFLKGWGMSLSLWIILVLWVAVPLCAVFCLWVAERIGTKLLFIFQGAKFLLVGAGATVIDLKIFEILAVISPASTVIFKAISFVISTLIKFWGNKYWTFGRSEKDNIAREALQFSAVTIVGLIIDISCFFFCTRILGPQFGMPGELWVKVSVIFAAIAAALWSFLGYKFFVFKK
jgi:putative flippase GtrA